MVHEKRSDDNSLTELQKSRNVGNAGNWELAESHRRRVTELILARCNSSMPQVCVLGAGNCNDVDLTKLCERFERVDLVDIDAEALARGVAAQGLQGDGRIRLHGSCDLSGIWEPLNALDHSASEEQSDQLIETSDGWSGLPQLGKFGVVVSTCLLSQLIDGVRVRIGEQHPRYFDVVDAVRRRHLRLLADLALPGGHAILLTDFVSSDTAPMLPSLSGPALSNALMELIKHHNFFTGLNPFRLQLLPNEDPMLASQVDSVHCEQPWLWNFGPRHYAVTAISFRRL